MTAMSEILRKKNTGEAGNGGEFGTKSHDEAPDGLIRTRRQELDGWPEKLTDPELDFSVKTQGSVIVTASVDGRTMFKVDGDDVWATNAILTLDEETHEQARDWTLAKAKEVNALARKEIDAAVARSRAAILSTATGAPRRQSDDDLSDLIRVNAKLLLDAERDMELASASLLARRVLAAYPDAVFARPEVEPDEDQRNSSWITVLDGELGVIAELNSFEDDNEDAVEEILDLTRNLDASPYNAWWSARFDDGTPGRDHLINLKLAAEWVPGSE